MMKVIDLCAGTGAFTQVFSQFRQFEVVFANDQLPESKQIYELNYPGHFICQNIHDIEVDTIPPFDILCAGFPCQAFSIAGKRLGFNDKRSNVFWKIHEIIEAHMPEYIILENVKNLHTHDHGNTFRTISNSLTSLGYHLKYKVLNTCKITEVPQNRERIYIVGFLSEDDCQNFDMEFEEVENRPITDFLEPDVDEKYYYDDRYVSFDVIDQGVVKKINENVVYQFRRHYVRENKSGVCPTLTANMGSGGHNVPLIRDDISVRKLTPRECFNLQGFPPDYQLPDISDSKLYKLAGNAITVPVLHRIVSQLAHLN